MGDLSYWGIRFLFTVTTGNLGGGDDVCRDSQLSGHGYEEPKPFGSARPVEGTV